MELFVELMASAGDRRTQARAREATRWRWLTALVPLAGSSSRLPSVALNGGSWWLSRGGSHGLRLPRCYGCHGSHGFNGVNVIGRE